MDESLLFWAKLGGATWPEQYHPVLCHLIDVAAVARAIWDHVFRDQLRNWFSQRVGLADDPEACARWLSFWCGAHDIGKLAACFQDRGTLRTAALRERLLDLGFEFSGGNKPHGTISTAILGAELAGSDRVQIGSILAELVAIAVGGHHGAFPADWHGIVRPKRWQTAQRALLEVLADLVLEGAKPPRFDAEDDQAVFMVLAGLTAVADWIGSNEKFFGWAIRPGTDSCLEVKKYLGHAQRHAIKALGELGWLDRAPPTGSRNFSDLFAGIVRGEPRPLQRVAEKAAATMTVPSLVLLEAPMGEGKTEAAWYFAHCWEQQAGQGTYVALPTMATSNQMFDRVGAFLQADAGKKNLMLLHGKAALNKRFERLQGAAAVYDNDAHPSAVVAEGWFAGNRKHGLLAPYGVGTIDQALLAVLQTRHMFVRLFGLAGKCVILDEVHAYDTYTTTLMKRLLRWLAALGCPVVLLSATLPREKRLQLLRAYAGMDLPEPAWPTYPRLSHWRRGEPAVQVKTFGVGTRPAVHVDWLTETDLAEDLCRSLADGGCAAVIRNTVALAQHTYCQLKKALEPYGIRVMLFHARFPFGRRRQIERSVLRRFGTKGDEFRKRRQRVVLVATQVIEQSLDLDFDLMISDVAPVDLVLQRAGRLWRHERSRPSGMAVPRLCLLRPADKDGRPDFGSSATIYDRYVLLRSLSVLQSLDPARIELPGAVEKLIEQVYSDEPLAIPDGWQADLDAAKAKWEDKKHKHNHDASDVAVWPPDESPLTQQYLGLDEEDPQANLRIQAHTRAPDTPPSIQFVLVYRVAGRDYLDPHGREPFDEEEVLSLDRVRRLLDNEVTISDYRCFAFFKDVPSPKRWKDSGLLRHHRVLRLDEDQQMLLTGCIIKSDVLIGIEVEHF